MDHSRAVTKRYLESENLIDETDTYWDDVLRNVHYFESDNAPIGASPSPKGKQVGEFDLIFVNYDDQVALYEEIKTSHADMLYAKDQIERAEEFFEDTEWDVYGKREVMGSWS